MTEESFDQILLSCPTIGKAVSQLEKCSTPPLLLLPSLPAHFPFLLPITSRRWIVVLFFSNYD
jgi:hypothetical protein